MPYVARITTRFALRTLDALNTTPYALHAMCPYLNQMPGRAQEYG